MKKILISLMTIALVASALGGGMFAYFSDIETSTGNTFTAGTIDIAVDNTNPWSANIPYTMADLKPCETGLIEFVVKNVGTNELQLWKHIRVTDTNTGLLAYPQPTSGPYSSEPEAKAAEAAGGGTQGDNNRIDQVINYDLKAGDNVIFVDADGVSVADVHCMWMPLGFLPAGESVVVTQSYHMRPETGNWAQGDAMLFDIELYAEQRLGNGPPESPAKKLFLENKTGDPDWFFIADDRWGILDYGFGGTAGSSTMNYDLKANGLTPGAYSLIYYPEPNPWPPSGIVTIGAHTAAADGTINVTGQTSGALLPSDSNAKVWLVPSSCVSGSSMTGWPQADMLFESNKINIP